MKKPICVRSSVQVTAPQSFNQWQQELAEEREFLRLIDKMKMHLKQNRERWTTKHNKALVAALLDMAIGIYAPNA